MMAKVVTLSAPTDRRFPPLSVCAKHERELEKVAPIYSQVDHGKHMGVCDACDDNDDWKLMLNDGKRPRGRPPLPPGEALDVALHLRISQAQAAKLDALDADRSKAVRRLIDEA